MGAALNFDANTVPPSRSLDPIPSAKYAMHIISSEVKPTNDGRGKFLAIALEVLEGEYKGRQVYGNLNISNPSAQAQEIAQRELSAICHATGVLKLANSSQLHHIPMMVKIGIEPAKNGYDAKNKIKGYETIDGKTATMKLAAPATAAAPAPSANAPAWAKKAS